MYTVSDGIYVLWRDSELNYKTFETLLRHGLLGSMYQQSRELYWDKKSKTRWARKQVCKINGEREKEKFALILLCTLIRNTGTNPCSLRNLSFLCWYTTATTERVATEALFSETLFSLRQTFFSPQWAARSNSLVSEFPNYSSNVNLKHVLG